MSWEPGLSTETLNPETLSYRVYIDDHSGNDPVVYHDSAGKTLATVATIEGLETGAVYEATVTAVNVIGESQHSSSITLYAGKVPSKIRTLVWESSTSTSVTFRWTLPESNGGLSIDKFLIYVD